MLWCWSSSSGNLLDQNRSHHDTVQDRNSDSSITAQTPDKKTEPKKEWKTWGWEGNRSGSANHMPLSLFWRSLYFECVADFPVLTTSCLCVYAGRDLWGYSLIINFSVHTYLNFLGLTTKIVWFNINDNKLDWHCKTQCTIFYIQYLIQYFACLNSL